MRDMKKDIERQLAIIEQSIAWAKKYGKDTFPVEEFKEYRRSLKRIWQALEENCSAAAYGESQVGKSYLISSLLSTPDKPFVITNNGRTYSFIDDINPSGGNTSKTESTGVVTRFTVSPGNPKMKGYVRIKNLSVADIIMLLVDAYYNDVKIDVTSSLRYDQINNELDELLPLWEGKQTAVQSALTEDDINDICEYIKDFLGNSAASVVQSQFRKIIADKIQYIASDKWLNVFQLLWNKNAELSRLFAFLINEYATLKFQTDVYVPFVAVLREKGTLLKIEWLDSIFGTHDSDTNDIPYVDVYDMDGNVLARQFKKSSLSALIAELTFYVPKTLASERKFLGKIDLLDFPGARSREKFKESEIRSVLPTVLRRGKVAYLFNKYSRSLRISSVLFCHHNDQKNEPTLGDAINEWIENNIGKTPEERDKSLTRTNGISPLFFIATKFNIELERRKVDNPGNADMLEDHWKRFKTVIPEIIRPSTWFDNWVTIGGIFGSQAFQSIYLLRDFYWSKKGRVFDGYEENISPESKVHTDNDYPDYFDRLRTSFLHNDFVMRHFPNPEEAWKSVATVNNDGSKAIIRDLDTISGVLDDARLIKYFGRLAKIRDNMLAKLQVYHEPEDIEQNNRRIHDIIGNIRLELDSHIGSAPEIFGYIIDRLMIHAGDIRKIAYDIIILKKETPKDFNEIILIRKKVGIDLKADKQENIRKLCAYYATDETYLKEFWAKKGFSLDDVVSNECNVATTVAEVVANAIFEYWVTFINHQTKELEEYIPHSDEVAFMLQNLCKRVGLKKIISDKIGVYFKIFSKDDRPNAIADFASLTLNNFVSTVGREYMNDDDLSAIAQKATSCDISVDLLSVNGKEAANVSLEEALQALDKATEHDDIAKDDLMKLPFWDNYLRWTNLLDIGLLYSADVSHQDPVANAAIKDLIDQCDQLYKQQ